METSHIILIVFACVVAFFWLPCGLLFYYLWRSDKRPRRDHTDQITPYTQYAYGKLLEGIAELRDLHDASAMPAGLENVLGILLQIASDLARTDSVAGALHISDRLTTATQCLVPSSIAKSYSPSWCNIVSIFSRTARAIALDPSALSALGKIWHAREVLKAASVSNYEADQLIRNTSALRKP
ncbi:hypothetical protein JNK13_05150 [bacterium]|nr:hypothetical protein [bacterium]